MGLEDVAQKAIELYGLAGVLVALLIGLLVRSERKADRQEAENDKLREQLLEMSDKRLEETKALILAIERFTVVIQAMQKVIDQVAETLTNVTRGRR